MDIRTTLIRLSAYLIINRKEFNDIKIICNLLGFWDYGCFNGKFRKECVDEIERCLNTYKINEEYLNNYSGYAINTDYYECEKHK